MLQLNIHVVNEMYSSSKRVVLNCIGISFFTEEYSLLHEMNILYYMR